MKRSPLRKTGKSSRKKLVRELDQIVSRIVRARDGKCVVCGNTEMLQAGHLLTRTAYATRWDLVNVSTQCASCNFRHNGNAWPYTRWFIGKYGQEVLEELERKHRTVTKIKDFELEELLISLRDIAKQYTIP